MRLIQLIMSIIVLALFRLGLVQVAYSLDGRKAYFRKFGNVMSMAAIAGGSPRRRSYSIGGTGVTASFEQLVEIALLAALFVPFIITTLLGVSTTSWPTMLQTIWTWLPVLVGFGIAVMFIRHTMHKR